MYKHIFFDFEVRVFSPARHTACASHDQQWPLWMMRSDKKELKSPRSFGLRMQILKYHKVTPKAAMMKGIPT